MVLYFDECVWCMFNHRLLLKVQEGLISSVHAEDFLEEIGEDTLRIEKGRSEMYK